MMIKVTITARRRAFDHPCVILESYAPRLLAFPFDPCRRQTNLRCELSGVAEHIEDYEIGVRRLHFCPTSKLSHDHGRHDSCSLRLVDPRFHSILLSFARGMTDVGVGCGALLGVRLEYSSLPPSKFTPRTLQTSATPTSDPRVRRTSDVRWQGVPLPLELRIHPALLS